MTERMNMLRITGPEKADAMPFDSTRDIPPATIKRLVQRAQAIRVMDNATLSLLHMASSLVQLTLYYTPLFDTDEITKMRKVAYDYREAHDWEMYARAAARIKTLVRNSTVELRGEDWEAVIPCLQREWDHQSLHWYAEVVANLTILYPERVRANLSQVQLGRIHEAINIYHQSFSAENFIQLAAAARILEPDRPLNITMQEWQSMKALLTTLAQEGDWGEYCLAAANMTILAADKIVIDNEGLHIGPPASVAHLEASVREMPETPAI